MVFKRDVIVMIDEHFLHSFSIEENINYIFYRCDMKRKWQWKYSVSKKM